MFVNMQVKGRVLIRHKRIHTGDNPHKCDVCEYASAQEGPLNRHKRIHAGEKM